MSTRYWNGVAGGALIFLAVSAVWWNAWSASSEGSSPALVFDPPFVGGAQRWILPGASQEFAILLRNSASNEVRIEELRFSCPCASGTIAGKNQLPVRIHARHAVPVKVTVAARKGERGPLEIQFGVVGKIGDQPVDVGSIAAVRFVQHLNAEPSFLVLGKINHADGKHSETVDLWFPQDGEAPLAELTVESDDPCVSARLDRFPMPQSSLDGENVRMTFAQLTVTLDPKIAPERMRASVIVRSGANELRIPVVAFIEEPSVEQGAK